MKRFKGKIFVEFTKDKFRTRKHILKKRDKALRNIIRYAFENSKYYHNSFSKAGLTLDNIDSFPLEKLPFINKKILLDNYDDILTDKNLSFDKIVNHQDQIDSKYHIVRSSGSSQKVGYFVYTQKAWNKLVIGTVREFIKSIGLRKTLRMLFKKTRVLYVAITKGQHGGYLLFSSCTDQLNFEIKLLDINSPLQEWIKAIETFNPDYLAGYPTAICLLTKEIINTRNKKMKIKGIISCGEALSKPKREYLKSVYRCPILNLYDASESLLIGSATENSFYLFDDYNYIEIINDQLYLTNLYNYVQPLIRYRMSDYIKLIYDKKAKYTKCQIGTGREEDILWFTNKDGTKEYLHPLMFEDFCHQGLLDYQLVQDKGDHFILNYVIDKKTDKKIIVSFLNKEIKAILDGHKLSFISFDTKQVNKILPDKRTGKKRLTVGLK
ncbi:MAG: hypothetical protein MJ214_03130 [Bacilli bacterium]|nr:hypothetical protein [Bacilli bacterium]